MSQPADEMLLIGKIAGPHGVRGDLKVTLISSHPEHIVRQKTLYLGDTFTPYAVSRLQEHKPGLYIVHFNAVTTRDDAEALQGLELFIPASKAAPLEEDEYFIHDLYGMVVQTSAGEELGKVAEVLETGANDVLVARRIGHADVLIPMIRDVIVQIDVASQRITITSLAAIQPE